MPDTLHDRLTASIAKTAERHNIPITTRHAQLLADGVADDTCRITVGARPAALAAVLTPRERELVTLAADGLGNQEIAQVLSLAPASVGTAMKRMYDRLGARSRVHAVALAIGSGQIAGYGRPRVDLLSEDARRAAIELTAAYGCDLNEAINRALVVAHRAHTDGQVR